MAAIQAHRWPRHYLGSTVVVTTEQVAPIVCPVPSAQFQVHLHLHLHNLFPIVWVHRCCPAPRFVGPPRRGPFLRPFWWAPAWRFAPLSPLPPSVRCRSPRLPPICCSARDHPCRFGKEHSPGSAYTATKT